VFIAISLNVGTGTASNVQNNTIKNFDWANSGAAAWTGINLSGGAVNIGTGTGNTIGATTGTGSVIVTGGATGTNVYGINIASTGTIDCQNNLIGSITVANTANAGNFYGIIKTTGAGTTTISNNTIGSTVTAGSINASSASTGALRVYMGLIIPEQGQLQSVQIQLPEWLIAQQIHQALQLVVLMVFLLPEEQLLSQIIPYTT